jgi:serine protease Do
MNVLCRKSLLAPAASLILGISGLNAFAHDDHDDAELLSRVSKAYAELTAKIKPAVVFIKVEKNVGRPSSRHTHPYNDPFEFFRPFFDVPEHRRNYPRQFKEKGQGSGFLISRDGYILTNNHVVGDADKITVKTHDGREYEAERIGTDPESEVAVIKIKGDNFPFLPAGDSATLDIGEVVIAIGNPFGLNETVTFGHVSAKGRDRVGIANYENFIQTDASINPGNSGGPLLNVKGEVVGINTAIYSKTGGNLGIGFAIPINMAMSIKDQLITSGKVVRSFLGVKIAEVTSELAPHFDLKDAEGILIHDVIEGTAADEAGLQAGDVILELNGEKVDGVGKFRNEVAAHTPGTEITLTLIRDGEQKKVAVTTGEYGGDESELLEELGLGLEDWDEEIANHMSYSRGDGVFVISVESGLPAADAGLMRGDLITAVKISAVNTVWVSTVEEFAKILGKLKDQKRDAVLLRVRRGRHSTFMPMKLQ